MSRMFCAGVAIAADIWQMGRTNIAHPKGESWISLLFEMIIH